MKEFQENDPENYRKAVADVPLRRIVDSAEVADSIVWLCSDEATYITGHKMIVDGGCSL